MTTLEQWIAPQVAANPEHSGFRLLANGLDAFVARAILIDLAERTLDLQYYIFHHDQTGSLLIGRLIAAADRGVNAGCWRPLGARLFSHLPIESLI